MAPAVVSSRAVFIGAAEKTDALRMELPQIQHLQLPRDSECVCAVDHWRGPGLCGHSPEIRVL